MYAINFNTNPFLLQRRMSEETRINIDLPGRDEDIVWSMQGSYIGYAKDLAINAKINMLFY